MKNYPTFVPYDDNNIDHLRFAPDYGQPDSVSAWIEFDSEEYPDYFKEVCDGIIHNKVKVVSDE